MAARTVEIAFLGSTAQLEAALARAGIVAEASGKKIGDSFNAGTDRAATGLHKLSATAASWGIPFTGMLDNVAKKLDEATTKTSKMTTALAEAGKVTLGAGLAGFAAAAFEGIKGATELQSKMMMLQTQAGATHSQVGQLTKGVEG